jgi:hypothetical protein
MMLDDPSMMPIAAGILAGTVLASLSTLVRASSQRMYWNVLALAASPAWSQPKTATVQSEASSS